MIAVYPGSFDPPTMGHRDIMFRASKIVDKLIVGVLNNRSKNSLFSVEEKIEMVRFVTKDILNIEVKSFSGLLVDFCKKEEANLIIRGLRAVTDFEYEFQMALANRNLSPEIETLFISASTKYLFLSSSVIKEIAIYGGNIDEMVPPEIKQIVLEKIGRR